MPSVQLRAEEIRETVRAAFVHFDVDRNGAIDATELRALVAELGGYLTDDDFTSALSSLDRDQNGIIDEEEFTVWWMARSGDLDGDGHMGEVERALERIKNIGQDRFRVDIHVASWRGMRDAVNRLLEEDQELVNEVDSTEYGGGNVALHYAAYRGHVEICELLIARGAKVNAINAAGCTPIFLASQQSQGAVVKFLLQHDASLRIPESKHQFTAIDVCSCDVILADIRARSGGTPSIPCAPIIESAQETSISITWMTPKERHDQLTPISAYKIKAVASNNAAPTCSILVEARPTECQVNGLKSDTEYVIMIAAINLHGMSAFSAPSLPIRTCPARPSAPIETHVRAVDATTIELSWNRGIGDITHFLLEQCVDAANNLWKQIANVEAHGTRIRHVVANLFVGQTYRFRVAAVSASAGRSDFSSPVEVKTKLGHESGKRDVQRGGQCKLARVTGAISDFVRMGRASTMRSETDSNGEHKYPSPRDAITRFEEAKALVVAPRSVRRITAEATDHIRLETALDSLRVPYYEVKSRDVNSTESGSSEEEGHVYFSDDDKE